MLSLQMLALIGALFVVSVAGDCYMHNPRGSNNRLNEGNKNTQNNERLFDSQNNNAGGYGVGPRLSFYEGSWLTVEWTNQHSCGNDNAHCQFILQYMCGYKDAPDAERIRDGTETTTIPNSDAFDDKTESGNDFKYGMHENRAYYRECKARERNKGLFTADQTVSNNQGATATRQNENGNGNNDNNANGFECPEERDYYPYWHPSPWKDIAVLTTDTSMCSWYREQSQNVMAKGHCTNDESEEKMMEAWEFNHMSACETSGHTWVEDGAHDMSAPECLYGPWSRDNHLGNGITDTLAGYMPHYNWSLPTTSQEKCIEEDNCVCVLRIRYNISTTDYEGRPGYDDFADASRNSKEPEKALILQDPYVSVSGFMLSLAINTNQYGRTFQDRSHTFEIKPRPSELSFNQRIFNWNVRGKRGNIVQTYPSVEYDFTPQHLVARQYDYIHFQWTGFNDNPNNGNNNAEGTDGTDRSNVVQIAQMADNYPMPDTDAALEESGVTPLFDDKRDRFNMAGLNQDDCLSLEDLRAQNNNDDDVDEDVRNCMKLNAAEAYFDGGIFRMNNTGVFYVMSTRNNNFSNRSQKASITIMPILGGFSIAIVAIGGALCLASIGLGALAIYVKKNPLSPWARYFDRV